MKRCYCQSKHVPMLISIGLLLTILLTSASTALAQSSLTIKGTILDNRNNSPLPDVSVVNLQSGAGTKTNQAGEFTIAAAAGETISFSYTGYETYQVKVTAQTSLVNHTMIAVSGSLDEVVVIGYGTSRRKDLTGAVSSLSGKQLASVPVANAAQALQGRIAGVNVTTQDGRPDASISVRIRGGGSISQSNEPLYIVDGFPVGSINDIPPQQIESIDVLKDASSTAIFGARGANGVIIVTTKNAKAGKMSLTYDNFIQFNKPTGYLGTMNAYDYVAYNWAYARAISAGYATAWEKLWAIGNSAATYGNAAGIDHYNNVTAENYEKQAYGPSFSHNHNISLSNGNANSKYLLTMSYTDNDGMKVNSWFKRANAMFKLNQKISQQLNFSFDTRFTDIERAGNESTTNGKGSILSTAYQFRPIRTEDVLGELDDRVNTQLGLYDIVLQDQYNPVSRMNDYLPVNKDRSIRSNASLSWTNPVPGLTARSEFGYNMYWNKGKAWSGALYNNYLDASGNKTFAGNASLASSEGWSLRLVNTLSYQLPISGKKHSANLIAGQEYNNSYSEGISMWGNRYPASFTADRAFAMMNQYLSGTTSVNSGISSSIGTPNRLISYFGRLNYSLSDKYLFTATFRADGSSRFAPTNRWGFFPAAAAAWKINQEKFMESVSWVNNLKLRLSYGEVGNDGISANLWKTQWSSTGLTRFSINEVQQNTYVPASTIANPNLKWETTVTRNIGLDFGLFRNKLTGSVEVYHNKTKDLLMLTSISAISGFSATYDNIGSTSNRGVELSLGGDLLNKNDLRLSANFNINFNKGRVDELAPGVNGLYKTQWGSTMTQPNTGDYILQVGLPVGQVRGYVYEGWYTTSDFNYSNGVYTLKQGVADIASGILGTVYGTTANKPGSQTAYPGVMKLKDVNGDGVVNEGDVGIIGNMAPKHTGGLTVNAAYKNLDFALGFNWSYGNQIYNAQYLAAFYGSKEDGLYRNRLDYLAGAYKIYDIQNGQLNFITDPAALDKLNENATTFLPYHENPVVSTLGIQDGSFLRLNTVTLGYTLPASVSKAVKINRLRVYAAVYNALTFTRYAGLDPEVNTNTSQGGAQYPTIGLDWGAYPRARSFTFGLNIEL